MRVSDQVVALDFGKLIAKGPPAAVRAHPEVIRAYLGSAA
jgi:branched-chain amino acid transport system ATP-binding protein